MCQGYLKVIFLASVSNHGLCLTTRHIDAQQKLSLSRALILTRSTGSLELDQVFL